MNKEEINIIVEGTLSVEELKKLLQCIREIEQNKPERIIKINMNLPDKTVEEMKEILSSVKPEFKYIKVLRKNRIN